MSVGADGEADVPAEAEEPGGSRRGRGAGNGTRPGEHREQRWRSPCPRHQLQQRRDDPTTQGPQEVSTLAIKLSGLMSHVKFCTPRGHKKLLLVDWCNGKVDEFNVTVRFYRECQLLLTFNWFL